MAPPRRSPIVRMAAIRVMQTTARPIKLRRRLDGGGRRKLAKNFITRIRSDDDGGPDLYGRDGNCSLRLIRLRLKSGNGEIRLLGRSRACGFPLSNRAASPRGLGFL